MLQTLNMVEAADEEVAKNIKKRNDQFKIAVPTLLSAWRFLRDSLDDGCNIANKATLRLSVDILMRLIWEADSMDCLYLCVGSFTVLVVFDAFYLQSGKECSASHMLTFPWYRRILLERPQSQRQTASLIRIRRAEAPLFRLSRPASPPKMQ
jgi:hypothetical protein